MKSFVTVIIGYDICLAVALVKMGRVYYIFQNPGLKKKVMMKELMRKKERHTCTHVHVQKGVNERKVERETREVESDRE